MFIYFSCMGGHWDYLLGQVINTAHHLILLDYLREEYGIMSHLHLQLLHHHFQKLAREGYEDRESLHAQGLITFEYQKLGGDVGEAPPFKPPREEIGQSYRAAQKHFGRYHPRAIPSCLSYQNDILSLLEDLEYARQHFLFFPSTNRSVARPSKRSNKPVRKREPYQAWFIPAIIFREISNQM